MIYLDSSVALAHLLSEDRRPPLEIWSEPLVSSRLLEFEMFCVLRGRGLAQSHEPHARELLQRVGLLELVPEVVGALPSGGVQLRTLDALHLATVLFLRGQGVDLKLASYDQRLIEGARRSKIPIMPL